MPTNHENNSYKYRISDLRNMFSVKGMPVSQAWIYRQERRGNLRLPKSTTNIKFANGERKGAVRVMTRGQMEEIVKAFLPGGSGKWFFK